MSGAAPVVVAAAGTGAGKTTAAVGLIGALRARGLRVQPFKVGPDFIDPGHHSAAAGRPSRNLDSWMVPPDCLRATYAAAAAQADVCVIEGVMGLFDGMSPGSDEASTAHVARLLGAPVVAVLDGHTAGRTLRAVALGLCRCDPDLPFAGFIVNRVRPGPYAEALGAAVADATGLPVFGCIAPDPAIRVPERHLGLRPAAEGADWVAAAARAVAAGVDLDGLLRALRARGPGALDPPRPAGRPHPGGASGGSRPRLAVARDEAFHFYYEDNLDLLRAQGLDLVPWSPLRDPAPPAGVAGLYFGGGFPERFAGRLAANVGARQAVAAAAAAGLPVWGECGGFQYLCRELVDEDGRSHAMAGVIPARTVMTPGPAGFGYREVRARRPNLLLPDGGLARGHEFHWSRVEWDGAWEPAWELGRPAGGPPVADGFARGSVLAGYVHLHLGSCPAAAARLAAACAACSPGRSFP